MAHQSVDASDSLLRSEDVVTNPTTAVVQCCRLVIYVFYFDVMFDIFVRVRQIMNRKLNTELLF